ncbi:MAG: D-tyrosyl-tRNA(Tyr) deacylase [Candidatus Cloacimonadota bacterium]|nr:MAG: D-tyrosyl-tRNA(Tyr) deacylase [Candidatus Cloacimonadota bacterium]
MIAVLQRVSKASVVVDYDVIGEIKLGFLVLLGIAQEDTQKDLDYIIKKVTKLRVFPDDEGKMNISLSELGGELLIVSQFTLLANIKKGNRPSFNLSAPPDIAKQYYNLAIQQFKELGFYVQSGEFGAKMEVALVNDGPVTIILNSKDI